MAAILHLAWRSLTHHGLRSALLAACIGLSFVLPVATELLVRGYGEDLAARSASTPLLVGARGSRYDLVLNSLYFEGRVPRPLPLSEAHALRDRGVGTVVPLVAAVDRARGRPLVGTTTDYFQVRRLRLASGSLPAMLGEAVVGAGVARELGLTPGDHLLTDQRNLYDLGGAYPLKLRITGVLAASGSADDGAVFVDLKTAWIVQGIGHGHVDAGQAGEDAVIRNDGQRVVLNAAVVEYTEITDANVDMFHFHVGPQGLPLTGILVWPRDARESTMLRARYRVAGDAQALVPSVVVGELLGFVFRLKRFFDASVALVGVATGLFLVLVVSLSLRVRQREIETLTRIGCGRGTVAALFGTELGIVVGAGVVMAVVAGVALAALLRTWIGLA